MYGAGTKQSLVNSSGVDRLLPGGAQQASTSLTNSIVRDAALNITLTPDGVAESNVSAMEAAKEQCSLEAEHVEVVQGSLAQGLDEEVSKKGEVLVDPRISITKDNVRVEELEVSQPAQNYLDEVNRMKPSDAQQSEDGHLSRGYSTPIGITPTQSQTQEQCTTGVKAKETESSKRSSKPRRKYSPIDPNLSPEERKKLIAHRRKQAQLDRVLANGKTVAENRRIKQKRAHVEVEYSPQDFTKTALSTVHGLREVDATLVSNLAQAHTSHHISQHDAVYHVKPITETENQTISGTRLVDPTVQNWDDRPPIAVSLNPQVVARGGNYEEQIEKAEGKKVEVSMLNHQGGMTGSFTGPIRDETRRANIFNDDYVRGQDGQVVSRSAFMQAAASYNASLRTYAVRPDLESTARVLNYERISAGIPMQLNHLANAPPHQRISYQSQYNNYQHELNHIHTHATNEGMGNHRRGQWQTGTLATGQTYGGSEDRDEDGQDASEGRPPYRARPQFTICEKWALEERQRKELADRNWAQLQKRTEESIAARIDDLKVRCQPVSCDCTFISLIILSRV